MSDLVERLRLAASDLTATMQDVQRIVAAPVLSAQQEATIRVLTDAAAEIERLQADLDAARLDLANEQADMHDLCMRLNTVLDLAGVDMGEGGYDGALRQLLRERDEARAEIAEAKTSCMTFGGVLIPNECSLLDNIKMLKGDIDTLQGERDEAIAFIERKGYRRCDIPACNCNSWHGGHANDRLESVLAERDEWRASAAGYGSDAEQYKHERDEARVEAEARQQALIDAQIRHSHDFNKVCVERDEARAAILDSGGWDERCRKAVAEVERLQAEVATLGHQLANALDSLKYECDQRLQIERAYALADTVLRDVREWYRCPWKHGASVEVIDLQRHAEWIARLDAFLAKKG